MTTTDTAATKALRDARANVCAELDEVNAEIDAYDLKWEYVFAEAQQLRARRSALVDAKQQIEYGMHALGAPLSLEPEADPSGSAEEPEPAPEPEPEPTGGDEPVEDEPEGDASEEPLAIEAGTDDE